VNLLASGEEVPPQGWSGLIMSVALRPVLRSVRPGRPPGMASA